MFLKGTTSLTSVHEKQTVRKIKTPLHRRSPKSMSLDLETDSLKRPRASIQQNFQIPWKNHTNDNSQVSKSCTLKPGTASESLKMHTDMHMLHRVYQTLRKGTAGSGSRFNSAVTGSSAKQSSLHKRSDSVRRTQCDCQSTHHSDGISSIHKIRGLSGEYSQNFEVESFEQISQCLIADQSFFERETVVAEEYLDHTHEFMHNPAEYVTWQKPALNNRSDWRLSIHPTFPKLVVEAPEFFCVPRKLLNDDMIPYNEEELMEFEYLDLGSYADRVEPKEVIQEVDEDAYNESPLIKKPLKSSRISTNSFFKEQQEIIHATGSVVIVNDDESGAFDPSCFRKGRSQNVNNNERYKSNRFLRIEDEF